jgi:hypothetical protein
VTLTRRHFLAATALVSAAGCAGVAGVVTSWWDQAPDAPLLHLSDDESAILDAFAEALYPSGGDPALGGKDCGAARYLDGLIGAMADEQANLLRLALHALDALPLATHGARLRNLAPPVSTEVVRGWLHVDQPELRGVVQSFSIFCGMAWFSHPDVAPRIAAMSSCGFGR